MAVDLREFVDEVRKARPSDVLEVTHEVDPQHETAAILVKLEERQRSPILVFRSVRGCSFPLVSNVCGSLGRLALALGCGIKDVGARYAAAAERPIAPVVVDDAPVHEVVRRGAEVDLRMFPALRYHADDAAEPYLTAAIVVARDPDDGVINLSYHRMMIASPTTTGIYIEPGRHLDGIFAKYLARGQDMPIAVFIGAHPAWSLGALYAGAPDVDEYDIIGGLLGHPLALTRCITWPDLVVPARAEFVLEARVSARERLREGPFGEFTGYGTGVTDSPVVHVEAITHRRDPWVQDVVSGHIEHLMLSVPALELRCLQAARKVAPGVAKVSLLAPLTAVISLRKHDDDEPWRIIEALCRDIYAKQVIVVDDDVDPADLPRVLGALALQQQPDRAVRVFTDLQGTPLDPSCDDPRGRTSKLGIDATRPLARTRAVTRNRIPPEVLDRIDIAALLKR